MRGARWSSRISKKVKVSKSRMMRPRTGLILEKSAAYIDVNEWRGSLRRCAERFRDQLRQSLCGGVRAFARERRLRGHAGATGLGHDAPKKESGEARSIAFHAGNDASRENEDDVGAHMPTAGETTPLASHARPLMKSSSSRQ